MFSFRTLPAFLPRLLLATSLAAALRMREATTAPAAAVARTPTYDGNWSVLIVTKQRPVRPRLPLWPVTSVAGASFTKAARRQRRWPVIGNGAVQVRVSAGSQGASGAGRLGRDSRRRHAGAATARRAPAPAPGPPSGADVSEKKPARRWHAGLCLMAAARSQAALRLIEPSASAVSFLSAAFSSSRFCCSTDGAVVAAELLRPGDQRAVARDLVVLDRLRGGDQRGVEHLLVVDLAGDLVRLLDDAVDRRAVDALRPRHRASGTPAPARFTWPLVSARWLWKPCLSCAIGRLLDHVGQRLHDLVLGVVDVLQRVDEQIVHRLDVLGEEAHGDSFRLETVGNTRNSFSQARRRRGFNGYAALVPFRRERRAIARVSVGADQ